jgi:MFS family permease
MSAARALRVPAVLREEPQFRLLFAGQALSVVGDRLSFIAMPFAVLATGGGLAQVGLVAAATSAPFLLFSLVAGVIADRHDRRRIMIASDAVRLVAQVLAGTLVVTGVAEWWQLALIAFAYGSADAFFAPAMYGLMPQIVGPANLQSANALRGLSNAVALVGGPALAGLLLTLLNPGGALLADAVTFAASIAFLSRMRPGVPEVADPVEPGLLEGLKGGWREVRSRSWVWSMLLGLASYHAIVLPSVFALGPVLAERDLGGPGAWALITAGFGVGSILGQLVLLRWRPERPLARVGGLPRLRLDAGGDHRQRPAGARHRRPRGRRGPRRTGVLHAVGDDDPTADPAGRRVARRLLRLLRGDGDAAAGDRGDELRRRRRRAAADAHRDERPRRRRGPRRPVRAVRAPPAAACRAALTAADRAASVSRTCRATASAASRGRRCPKARLTASGSSSR